MEKNLRCQATKAANLVLGQTDFTSSLAPTPPNATSLANPTSVVVDPVTRKIFVSDHTNNRVLRYASADALASGAAAEMVLGQASFTTNVAASPPTSTSNGRELKSSEVRPSQGEVISESPAHVGTMRSDSRRTLAFHGHGGSESTTPWVEKMM
jgi:hypothetical protein